MIRRTIRALGRDTKLPEGERVAVFYRMRIRKGTIVGSARDKRGRYLYQVLLEKPVDDVWEIETYPFWVLSLE